MYIERHRFSAAQLKFSIKNERCMPFSFSYSIEKLQPLTAIPHCGVLM